jgi:hypothetical protein
MFQLRDFRVFRVFAAAVLAGFLMLAAAAAPASAGSPNVSSDVGPSMDPNG